MPTDLVDEAKRMADAFGVVAAGALPVGLAAWGLARRLGRPALPRWRAPGAGWTGFDILALFVLNFALSNLAVVGLSAAGFFQAVYGPGFPRLLPADSDPAGAVAGGAVASAEAVRREAANQLRVLWAVVVAAPGLAAGAVGLWVLGNGRLPKADLRSFPGRVAAGVLGWAVLTPAVFHVHFVTAWASEQLGSPPAEHPLTQVRLADAARDVILFAVAVCGLTPFAEELLFRGILVGWVTRRTYRAWVVMAAGTGLAAATGGLFDSPPRWAAAAFAVLLVAGLALVRQARFPRTASAIYSTAAAFALAHSAVWPTPVPLFVLGLGLGYLAARTRGITGCVVAHGLFNAVSFVFLLMGGK